MRAFMGILAAVMFCATGVPAQEATRSASVAEVRLAARAAALQGDFRAADALSSTLLARDPNDAEALLIRAVVARAAGQPAASVEAATKAYGLLDEDGKRFDAAMLAAEGHARQEQFTRSQLWLRRADQVAPNPQAEQLVQRTYGQVAARNPLSVQLSFSLQPSNNVNNGAETTVIEIGGLPFSLDDSGRQLGGYEASTGVSLSFRLAEDRTHRTDVLGELYFRKVWLDSDAKAEAPDVEGSDFDYGVAIIGLRETRLLWPDLGPTQLTGLLGQSWYGGDEQARWIELQGAQLFKRSDTLAFRLGATVRDETRIGDAINDSLSLGLSGDVIFAGDEGRTTSFGATIKSYNSDSATIDGMAYGLKASHSFGTIGSVQPSIRAAIETRDFEKWSSTPGGRRDDSLSLGLNVVFPEVSYYGFLPQLSLNARRVWSDVGIYDRNQFSVGFTAVSRF